MNFYLHGRYLMERPANQALIMAAGLLDLSIITASSSSARRSAVSATSSSSSTTP